MSVRRRNIQNRLASDLELERGSHRQTRGLFDVRGKALALALDERDAARKERDRLKDLAAELGRYFNSEPPAPLSRQTDLFLLLQEVAPRFVKPLPPTPAEFVEAVLNMVGTTTAEFLEVAGSVHDSGGKHE